MSTDDFDKEFGFAPDYDEPVPYRHRIRTYYQALGYGAPYRWAHYRDVPFTAVTKPLAEMRIAFITTAAPYKPDAGDQGPGAPYNSAAKFYNVLSGDTTKEHDLRISHVGIDRKHTTAEDSAPGSRCRRCARRRRTGGSARSGRAFTTCRPIAATKPRSTWTVSSCSRVCAKTRPTPPSSPPIVPCVTNP